MDRDEILRRVRSLATNGEISCAAAHRLAEELAISPAEIGQVVNSTEIHFTRCQLGLFGYGLKSEGTHRIIQPARHIPEDLARAIEARAKDGRISCLDVWEIADQFEYPRLAVANVVEAMGLRIKPCQLGCF